MKRMLSLFCAIALLACLLPQVAFGADPLALYFGFCGENITWTLNAETGVLEISGAGKMDNLSFEWPWLTYSSSIKTISIADSVTSVGASAFKDCSEVTSVTIPNSVTAIDSSAFEGCTALGSITIPNSVTSIGSAAFRNCTSLARINIPDSITVIDTETFYNCTSLTWIEIPDGVTSIMLRAFYGCTSLGSITIPDSVSCIMSGAFHNTDYYNSSWGWSGNYLYIGHHLVATKDNTVTSAYIRSGTKTIADYAFYEFSALTSISIPDSVTSIGNYAFQNCYKLENISIPDSVTMIGADAFTNTEYYDNSRNWINNILYIGNFLLKGTSYCKEITVREGTKLIASSAFMDCTKLQSITIPESVTSIGAQAFEGCSELKSITIPGRVASIGERAFEYCSKLESVTICEGVTSIGDLAFAYCSGLMILTIPDSATGIGKQGFFCCAALKSVTIGSGVASIGDEAFKSSGLLSVTIPDNVQSIGDGAFARSSSLLSINVTSGNERYCSVDGVLYNKSKTHLLCYPAGRSGSFSIPSGVTYIGYGAFDFCTGLTSVSIPDGVKYIGEWAFNACTALKSVSVPSSVKSIGFKAFYDCRGLTSITIEAGVTSIGGDAFGGCTALTSVCIPGSVTKILSSTFFGCTALVSVTIGHGVETVGSYAFSGCTKLASVTIGSNVKSIGNNAFPVGAATTNVYFHGTKAQWKAIEMGLNNDHLDRYARMHYLDAHKHEFSEIITSPTCTVFGYTTHVCSCGYSYADAYVDALGHDFRSHPAKAATCTETGWNAYKTCTRCDYTTFTETPPLGHNLVKHLAKAASCTEAGWKAYKTCTRCDYTTFTEIPPLGHALIHTNHEDGTHTANCTRCDYSLTEAHTFTNGVCICGASEVVIEAAYPILDENINMVYAVSVPAGAQNPRMVFTYQGTDYTVTNYTVNDSGKYCFTFADINPQCMGDPISAVLHAELNGEDYTDAVLNYSVKQYCVNTMNSHADDPALKTLLSDLLTYGATAQEYSNYKADELVTEGLNLTPSRFEAFTCKPISFSGIRNVNVDWIAASLVLQNTLAVRFYFTTTSVRGLTVRCSINGRLQSFSSSDFVKAGNGSNLYYIEMIGVNANEFDDEITAAFYQRNTQIGRSVSYSVNTYISSMQNSENTNLRALVRALYNYGASAAAYSSEKQKNTSCFPTPEHQYSKNART